MDSLTSIANPSKDGVVNKEKELSLKIGKISEREVEVRSGIRNMPAVLILGAGRVCRPAAEFLASGGSISCSNSFKTCQDINVEIEGFQVIVASLYLKDAEEVWI